VNYSKIAEKYEKYLEQLLILIDNRLNDFHRISQTNDFIKSCQIKIFDEIQLKSCTPREFGIEIVDLVSINMIKRFYFSKLDHTNKVEKITFQLNSSQNKMIAFFLFNFNSINT
jgi:hypothetical protein